MVRLSPAVTFPKVVLVLLLNETLLLVLKLTVPVISLLVFVNKISALGPVVATLRLFAVRAPVWVIVPTVMSEKSPPEVRFALVMLTLPTQ